MGVRSRLLRASLTGPSTRPGAGFVHSIRWKYSVGIGELGEEVAAYVPGHVL